MKTIDRVDKENSPRQSYKVLFFTSALGGGGAEKHLVRVANHLDRARFDVDIVVARGGGSYESDLAADIDLYALNVRQMRYAFAALNRIINREHPDLICSMLDHANCVLLATRIWHRWNPPIIVVVQNPPSILYKRVRSLGNYLIRFGIYLLYDRATHIIALSNGVKEDIVHLVPRIRNRASVIYNAGIDETIGRLALEPVIVPTRIKGQRVIATCGRLKEQKGLLLLLRAFARVRAHLSAQLWIVGDGELRPRLEEEVRRLQLEESVWFTGFQKNPYRFMRAADVFVLSSLWEGFGNVIVEAMATGTPVVATDCCYGPREIISDNEYGLLVPPSNERALSEAVIKVLEDAALRSKLEWAGRRRAQDFAASKIAAQYGHLFEEVIAGRSGVAPR